MRHLHRTRSHAPDPAAERRLPESRRPWGVHPRSQLISDGVVAGYLHDISVRHSGIQTDPWARRPWGDQE
jgi:hypothetical protein